MTAREVVAEYLPRVRAFITEIEATDDSERATHLRRVSMLIRFLSVFYEVFLPESFNIRIRGFSYKDKRKVSRQLVRVEMGATPDDGLSETNELAALFEELSDLFHGSMDFGYSEEDEDYVSFHRDAFPSWLDTVERWLRATGDENDRTLANDVDAVWKRYSNVIETSY
ncbi:MAG: hypothetical protein ABSH36_12940 [Solirubrobacteraceae bacterium]